jgi:hypothetical protein
VGRAGTNCAGLLAWLIGDVGLHSPTERRGNSAAAAYAPGSSHARRMLVTEEFRWNMPRAPSPHTGDRCEFYFQRRRRRRDDLRKLPTAHAPRLNPRRAWCAARCFHSRFRALALFGRRPRRVDKPVMPASENQHTAHSTQAAVAFHVPLHDDADNMMQTWQRGLP